MAQGGRELTQTLPAQLQGQLGSKQQVPILNAHTE